MGVYFKGRGIECRWSGDGGEKGTGKVKWGVGWESMVEEKQGEGQL